jgi:hypothetical protein
MEGSSGRGRAFAPQPMSLNEIDEEEDSEEQQIGDFFQ